MTDPTYDVFISGMGPVGAAAALFAGRAGLRTCVVDRAEDVFPLPRATHFDAEIMRLFQGAGLAEALDEVVRTYDGGLHLGADGEPIRDFRVPAVRGPLGWYPHYTFIQPQVDRLLREHARATEGVDCRLETEVLNLRQHDDHVEIDVRTRDGEVETVTARYVIACDGASSPIRKQQGIGLIDYDFDEPWIIIDAVVPEAHLLPDYSVMYCDPARPGTYIPQPGRHRRWEFMLLDGEDAATMESRAAIEALLAPYVDVTGLEIVRSAVYRFHGLIAEQWRDRRVFLAGDAAHQTPPFYGQGMCHGIRDVSNLVWKLRLALRDPAFEDLLDTYGAERHPHVKAIIDAAVENGRYICILDPEEARERDARLRARMAAGQDVRSFRSVIPGLTTGIVSPDRGHDEWGQLMVQPSVTGRDGAEMLLDTLLGDGFALICRRTPEATADHAWFTDVAGGRVVVLDDKMGDLDRWLDAQEVSAVLVRPDRYIYGLAAGTTGADRLLADLHASLILERSNA